MAWWLDPAHNVMPAALRAMSLQSDAPENAAVRGVGGGSGRGKNAQTATSGIMPMPKGVDSIRPDNRNNALLVNGTAESIAELRRIVELLDSPLQQVDIELSFVETNSADAVQNLRVGGALDVAVERDKGAELARLKSDPQAHVQTFRLRAFNNHTARQTAETTEFQFASNTQSPDSKLLVQRITRLEFTTTPTINQDGTITVALSPKLSSRLVGEDLEEAQTASVAQRIDTISNVRDGETLVIGGLRSLSQAATTGAGATTAGADGNKASRGLVILVTPRIVRRATAP
jgi:type II secretory pathway component GspD/PulD (secretin)